MSLKVIVTGGAGFVGKHLVDLLHEKGYSVLIIDKLTYASDLSWFESIRESERFNLHQVDICDGEQLGNLFRDFQPDAVLHLAAESHVDRSIDAPSDFVQTNVVGTYRLLEATRDYLTNQPNAKERFRFIHVSTDEVYGTLTHDAPRFTETTAYDPRSPYSASKAASDHLVRSWFHTYDLPVIVTHCSNNYGPGQHPEKLIPKVTTRAINQQSIPVYGDGKNIRDWIHVADHVRALEQLIHKGEVGETYNVGSNCERSNIDVVRQICSILDTVSPQTESHTSLIEFVQDRPGHDFRYGIDATKIRSKIGWRPTVDFEAGLRDTVTNLVQAASTT